MKYLFSFITIFSIVFFSHGVVYASEQPSIKVFTFNVGTNWDAPESTHAYRTSGFAEMMKNENIDIATFQEFNTSARNNARYVERTISKLNEIDYPMYVYASSYDPDNNISSLVIFSKYPFIEDTKSYKYLNLHNRVVQSVVVTGTPIGNVRITNSHTYNEDSCPNLEEVFDFARSFSDENHIVFGDFNVSIGNTNPNSDLKLWCKKNKTEYRSNIDRNNPNNASVPLEEKLRSYGNFTCTETRTCQMTGKIDWVLIFNDGNMQMIDQYSNPGTGGIYQNLGDGHLPIFSHLTKIQGIPPNNTPPTPTQSSTNTTPVPPYAYISPTHIPFSSVLFSKLMFPISTPTPGGPATPTPNPTCDACGKCAGVTDVPPDYDKCLLCLYEGADPNGIQRTDYLWTILGCVEATTTNTIQTVSTIAVSTIGGISFIILIYASFLILTSKADANKLKKGRTLFISAISAILLVIFATFVLRFVGVELLRIPGMQ